MTYSESTEIGISSEAQAIADLAFDAATPEQLESGQVYSYIVPAGAQQVEIDTEHLLDAPRRTTGIAHLHDGASLANYVNRFGVTSIYADAPNARITAVVNGPTEDETGWGDHRAVLQLTHTPEWKRWVARSGTMGKLIDLAELIEDRIIDIVNPDGATMLELAQSFEATSTARFKRGERLTSGERQFAYEETIEAKAGRKGALTIPERFELVLAPFVGEDPISLTARLRYRVNDGDLKIGYVIDRIDDVLRDAFVEAVGNINSLTDSNVAIYYGTAP